MGAGQQQPCQIWVTIERNPHYFQKDLFDFTKEREVVKTIKASFPSRVSHEDKKNEVYYSTLKDPRNELFSLDMHNNKPDEIVLQLSNRQSRASLWKYLPSNQSCQLEEGDLIKLGKIQLYLKQLKYINPKKTNIMQQQFGQNFSPKSIRPSLSVHGESPLKNSGYFGKIQRTRMKESQIYSMKISDHILVRSGVSEYSTRERSCRICFQARQTVSNPLFNVCLCAGTVKYVHFECLKSWFRSKTVKFQAPHCYYYCYQPLECQICKYSISNEVIHNGRKYCLFDYQQIHPPFAKFQHYADSKVFQIVIRLQENLQISVGRGTENDLNLNDSSISRSHCFLEYSCQRLVLRSLNNKYGTYVQLKKNIQLSEGPVGINISNYLIWLQRRGGSMGMGQCCTSQGRSVLLIR